MNIFDRLTFNGTFCGMPTADWQKVLTSDETAPTQIKVEGKGVMILDNGTLVKCIGEYYCQKDRSKLPVSASDSQRCYKTRRYFFSESETNSTETCRLCHLRCSRMHDKKSILYINKNIGRK